MKGKQYFSADLGFAIGLGAGCAIILMQAIFQLLNVSHGWQAIISGILCAAFLIYASIKAKSEDKKTHQTQLSNKE